MRRFRGVPSTYLQGLFTSQHRALQEAIMFPRNWKEVEELERSKVDKVYIIVERQISKTIVEREIPIIAKSFDEAKDNYEMCRFNHKEVKETLVSKIPTESYFVSMYISTETTNDKDV